jgi:hypothetical protein
MTSLRGSSLLGKKDITWWQANSTGVPPNQESKQSWGANLSFYKHGALSIHLTGLTSSLYSLPLIFVGDHLDKLIQWNSTKISVEIFLPNKLELDWFSLELIYRLFIYFKLLYYFLSFYLSSLSPSPFQRASSWHVIRIHIGNLVVESFHSN